MDAASVPSLPGPPPLHAYQMSLLVPSSECAEVVTAALNVDAPIAETLRRITCGPATFLAVADATGPLPHAISINIQSASLRALRTAIHAALEQMHLAIRTVEAFGHHRDVVVGGGSSSTRGPPTTSPAGPPLSPSLGRMAMPSALALAPMALSSM